ncbi:uncharacterized protein LOC133533949 [Cydia pomonella]|uniref:uncharacterized protein LOC133533949 n=1 Tax=Cydia pomonella TaxID=82600 RepID=UPI002ADD8E73|nr:uncharacterized protein LOC133533949 [Cydia pomonella]
MSHTSKMKTRRATRKERVENQEQGEENIVHAEQETKKVPEDTSHRTERSAAGSAIKHESRRARSLSQSKSRSSVLSIEARKKRLLLEAEKQKAEIRMQLIDKELEADLADLEEEEEEEEVYSSHDKEDRTQNIENWMEKSQQELDKLHIPAENEPVAGTSRDTIQMLAATVQTLAAASVQNKPNTNLLSRICTPRDLPEFSGDPLDWLQFKRAYEESTEVCQFSPKENLWRLRKCLRGAAKDAVSALLISATSPERIMETLELRFGNPDCIISKLMQDIKRIQPVSSEYQKDIVQFSVKVQNFVEAVRSVGREEYLQGMSLVPLILSKLPTVLLSKWSDYSFPLIKTSSKSRLDILADFLNTEAIRISTTSNIYTMSQRADNVKTKGYDKNPRPQHVFLQSEQDNADKCYFCHGSKHKLSECKQFRKALRKVRWQYVKRNGICYKCLDSRHNRETCPAPVCDKDNCGQAHHKLLHFVNNITARRPSDRAPAREVPIAAAEPAAPQEHSAEPAAGADPPTAEVVTNINASSCKVFLKVVPIRVYTANGKVINCSALLDDGSCVTMISADLAARAGLRGHRETMRVKGPWKDNQITCDSMVVKFELSGKDNKVHSIKAKSVSELSLPPNSLSFTDCTKYSHLKNIASSLCNDNDLKPEVLIGQDNYHLLVPLKVILGKKNEPSATLSPLGWCIHGPMRVTRATRAADAPAEREESAAVLFVSECGREEQALRDLHEEVQRGFALDALGISGKPRQNVDDVRAVEQLERTARLVDGRWQVGLPWKDPNCTMPDSFPSALNRLKGIERKMSRDPGYSKRYSERVDHLLNNDFATELKETQRTQRTWYLPHFGVDNVNKNACVWSLMLRPHRKGCA